MLQQQSFEYIQQGLHVIEHRTVSDVWEPSAEQGNDKCDLSVSFRLQIDGYALGVFGVSGWLLFFVSHGFAFTVVIKGCVGFEVM